MRWQRVIWHHDLAEEPTVLYSEVDDDGFELRKVDEYRDGRLDLADEVMQTGTTQLADQLMPSIEEIAAQEEFEPREISRDEFEAAWLRAVEAHAKSAPPKVVYTWQGSSIDAASRAVGRALGIELSAHDSSFYGGDHFHWSNGLAEVTILENYLEDDGEPFVDSQPVGVICVMVEAFPGVTERLAPVRELRA